MKSGSRQAYQQRIDRVLARVQQTIEAGEELPDLAALAALSHFSPFHFHRLYRALTGETLKRSLGRLKLARALHLLADQARSITNLALAVGYGTPRVFARVLAQWLPESGETVRDAPILYAYLDDPEQVPEPLLRTDILVPLA